MEQARLVHRELSDAGPRLVRGVAGSGKTLVLAHWAVRALSGLGVAEVGVVYTNRALRPLLEHMLASAWSEQRPNAGAMPWHRVHLVYLQDLLVSLLADRDLPEAGCAGDTDRYDYEHQARRILAAGPVEPRFPALLVDEAQDAGDAPLRVLAGLVEPGVDGRRALMMFYDNAQNVFGRTRPQWRELGVDLRGRSDVMRESFRTTRAISELALNLLGQLSPLDQDPDLRELMRATGHDALPLLQHDGRAWRARFCSVSGERPEVTVFDSRDKEQAAIIEVICRWIQREGVSPGAVRVVTQSKTLRQELLRGLRGHGFRVEHRTHEGFSDCDDAVVITTPHSFKGYDAEVVVVPGIDRFAPQGNLLTAPLYVALTRARTRAVGHRGHGPARFGGRDAGGGAAGGGSGAGLRRAGECKRQLNPHRARTYRRFRQNVVRLMPRRFAASLTSPWTSANTLRISASSSSAGNATVRPARSSRSSGGKSSSPSSASRPTAKACSTTLNSSRTLPGQSWSRSARIAAGATLRTRRGPLRLCSSMKCQSRSSMSSRRSRSAGRNTGTTRSRYIRSSRKRPALTSSRSARCVAATMRTST